MVSSTRGGVEIFKQFFLKKMIADNDEDSMQRKEENIMNDCIVIPILNVFIPEIVWGFDIDRMYLQANKIKRLNEIWPLEKISQT